jgi:hypothetical protein
MEAPRDNHVELRGMLPRDVVDVLDAVSAAKRMTRIELVARILASWAGAKHHEAMLVHRVTRGNPPAADPAWKPTET